MAVRLPAAIFVPFVPTLTAEEHPTIRVALNHSRLVYSTTLFQLHTLYNVE
jgi:hypothetical protein